MKSVKAIKGERKKERKTKSKQTTGYVTHEQGTVSHAMAQVVGWRAAPHSVTTALPVGRVTLILELLLIKELTTQFRHSKNAAAAPKQKGGEGLAARLRSKRAQHKTD